MIERSMIAIVGLGNPGKEYVSNRHNVGFMVADKLASELNLNFSPDKYIFSLTAKNKEYILTKPETYINESGKAIKALIEKYQLTNESTWVVQDDTEFPLGEVRVKFGGGSGGHNGIKSIDQTIGQGYWRIRVGVGRPNDPAYDLASYVLADFGADEKNTIDSVIDQAASYLLKCLKEGTIEATTFRTNGKETTDYPN